MKASNGLSYDVEVIVSCYIFFAEDPTEHNDLSRELPGVVRTMKMKVKKYLETLQPAYPPFKDPKSNPKRFGRVWSPGWCKV